jgi:hypothetical protein
VVVVDPALSIAALVIALAAAQVLVGGGRVIKVRRRLRPTAPMLLSSSLVLRVHYPQSCFFMLLSQLTSSSLYRGTFFASMCRCRSSGSS